MMLLWRATVLSLLFYCIMPLLSSMHTCPASDQYTFSCSTCLSFSMSNSTYSAASQECEGQGGALVTVHNDLQWNMLQLYLESLNLTGMWIGYRLGQGGELSGDEWDSAPDVVVNSIQQSLSIKGSEGGVCVMVMDGELVNTKCSEERSYICLYTYYAPSLDRAHPPVGIVYQQSSEDLLLEAHVVGLGISSMEWILNHTSLMSSAVVEMRSSHDNTWAELHVTGYNQGYYELLVTNPAGRAVVATWTVQDASLGSFTRIPQDITIPEGSIAFFECTVEDAHPVPTYTWYKGDVPIIPDGTNIYVSNATHTLLIRNVSEQDEGEGYHCHVENIAGYMDSPTATLTLRSYSGSAIEFLLQPQTLTVLEGESYSVECVALHRISTYTYHVVLDPLHQLTKSLFYPSSPGFPATTVDSVSLDEHNGINASCLAGPTGRRPILSDSAVLTVHARPHIIYLTSNVYDGTGPHSIPPSTELEMECSFSGVPDPIQRWYRDGTMIMNNDVLHTSRSESEVSIEESLHLLPVSGIYQCHTSNQYSNDISTTVLCAQTLPGPTSFYVQPDTTTSLLVTWSLPNPPSTDPLLLRYTVITTHTITEHTISSGTLLPHQSPWVVEGLNVSSEYRVRMISWSPLGSGSDNEEQSVYTFGPAPQLSPDQFLNITVSRTHDNNGLVVQWYHIHSPQPGTIFSYYEIQYHMGKLGDGEEEEGEIVKVNAIQNWLFVDDLKNAHDYEIRLRIGVQVQRSPPDYDHTPWTEWMSVVGVTTPPPISSSNPPSQGPAGNPGGDDRDDVLLVAVLVPILSVLLLVALLVSVTVGGWRLWAKRRATSYRPSQHERRNKGRRVPMGKDVFNLPTAAEIQLEAAISEEDGDYCTMTSTVHTSGSSRPSSQSEDLTVDSPVHMQNSNTE